MKRALLLGLLALAAPVQAGETARLPYRILAEKIAAFEGVPAAERDRVDLTLSIRPKAPPAEPLRVWMELDGRRIDIPVDATGRMALRPTADLATASPMVETNQPKGTLDLELSLSLRLPDPTRFRYADLRASAAQIDALVKRAAGSWGLFTPAATRVLFTCAQPAHCSLTLHRRQGPEVRLPDEQGRIALALTAALDAENPDIQASGSFTRIAAASD